MRRSIKCFSAIAVLVGIVFLAQSAVLAKGGQGKGHGAWAKGKSNSKVKKDKTTVTTETTTTTTTITTKGSRPPGWDRGRKTGWRGGKYPPGWSKWGEKKQVRWSTDRENAHAEIQQVMVTYNVPMRARDDIGQAFDEAILGGMMINKARKKLITGLKDPNQQRLFMINTTQSVLEFLK